MHDDVWVVRVERPEEGLYEAETLVVDRVVGTTAANDPQLRRMLEAHIGELALRAFDRITHRLDHERQARKLWAECLTRQSETPDQGRPDAPREGEERAPSGREPAPGAPPP